MRMLAACGLLLLALDAPLAATYTALYTYGYRNVYELGELLEVRTTRIPFDPPVR